jgi:DNA-binding response OmpR family regulator
MKRTVLIADGEPRISGGLKTKLLESHFEVFCTENIAEALARFEVRSIDVLLLDLDVPIQNGWTALAQMVQLNPTLCVIGLTERSDATRADVVSRLSAVAEKPVDVRNLLGVIESMLTESAVAKRFWYVPSRTPRPRKQVFHRFTNADLCPVAYSGWGIND